MHFGGFDIESVPVGRPSTSRGSDRLGRSTTNLYQFTLKKILRYTEYDTFIFWICLKFEPSYIQGVGFRLVPSEARFTARRVSQGQVLVRILRFSNVCVVA
jgi:hypothetical protein